ncbi:MAG: LptF/LptG family permease [Pseudomonadota bacterium]|nr:LptF/LptG family permease [Pseudomonadota bacterium]
MNRISTYMMGILLYKFCLYTFITVTLVSCVELFNRWSSLSANIEMSLILKLYGSVVLVMSSYLLPGLWVMAVANTSRQLQNKGEMLATSLMGWPCVNYWKQVWIHGILLTIIYASLIGWYSPLALQQQLTARNEILSQLNIKQLITQFNTLSLDKGPTLMFWVDNHQKNHGSSHQSLFMNMHEGRLSIWKWADEAIIHHDPGKQGIIFRNGRGLVVVDQKISYNFEFKDGFMSLGINSELSNPMSMFALTAPELWYSTDQVFQKELISRVGMVCSILLLTWWAYCLFSHLKGSSQTITGYVYLVMGYISYVVGLLFLKSVKLMSSTSYACAMISFVLLLLGVTYKFKVRSEK